MYRAEEGWFPLQFIHLIERELCIFFMLLQNPTSTTPVLTPDFT